MRIAELVPLYLSPRGSIGRLKFAVASAALTLLFGVLAAIAVSALMSLGDFSLGMGQGRISLPHWGVAVLAGVFAWGWFVLQTKRARDMGASNAVAIVLVIALWVVDIGLTARFGNSIGGTWTLLMWCAGWLIPTGVRKPRGIASNVQAAQVAAATVAPRPGAVSPVSRTRWAVGALLGATCAALVLIFTKYPDRQDVSPALALASVGSRPASVQPPHPLTQTEIDGPLGQPEYKSPTPSKTTARVLDTQELDIAVDELFGDVSGTFKKRRAEQAEADSKNLTRYQKAAAQGNQEAQVHLARIFRTGSGTEADFRQSLYWTWKAAIQGHAPSQAELGDAYESGWSVSKDLERARLWYMKAGEQGNSDAEWALAQLFRKGAGVPRDYRQALVWGVRAAEHGDESAQRGVGNWYLRGEGTEQNKVEAYKWLNLAAAAGIKQAVVERDQAEAQMSPAEIAEAQRRATAWRAGRSNQ